MIPISYQQPTNQTEKYDLNFGTSPITATIPGLGIVKYKVGAVGNPFHGLNIGGYIVNKYDFAETITYNGVKFAQKVTTGSNTVQAWTGQSYITLFKPNLISQISGYRCGDVILHQVPGVQAISRDSNATEAQVKAKWKTYALISGFSRYVHKAELGKNTFIYSAGVGRAYKIELTGVLNSGTVKLVFKVTRFGVFGYKFDSVNYTFDTGQTAYINGTVFFSSGTPTTIRGMEKIRVMDVNSNGSKALVAVYIQPRSPIPEDDGVSDLTSGMLAYAEVEFEENTVNNLAKVKTFTTKRNFTNNNTTGIYFGSNPTGSKYFINSLGRPNSYGGSDGSVIAWVGYGYNTTGQNITRVDTGIYALLVQNALPNFRPAEDTGSSYYITGSATLFNSYSTQNFMPTNVFFAISNIGIGRYVATNQNNSITKRYIHACYNQSGTISEVYVQYTNIGFNYTRCLDAQGSGSGTYSAAAQPDSSTQTNHSGSFSMSYTHETGSYALSMFEMYKDNQQIDFLKSEVITPATKYTKTQQWITYSVTNGTAITIDTGAASNAARPLATTVGDTTPNPSYVAQPAELAGKKIIPSIGMAYDYFANAYGTKSFYRDLDVLLDDYGGKIWPFARVETNKIVSFNIGRAGYSMVVSETPTDNTGVKLYTTALSSGNHMRKTVYNVYTGALATNSYSGWGLSSNPASEIRGDLHYCSFNPATGESVINELNPVVWV